MSHAVLVFLGAGIGGVLRHAVNILGPRLFGPGFPWSTFVVNVAGSLAMGLLAGWFAARAPGGAALRLFLTTGILGGFTTFSAFSLDAVLLLQRGEAAAGAAYILGSVLLSLAALAGGLWLVRAVG
ncbi:MAG: fluoride efflux transporter CrcB [Methylobacteriaceae bacterium]|nr:fluoride efflux transporter CrcB [Methylobacteriaceae bacterium]